MERVVQLSKSVEVKKDSYIIGTCTVEEPVEPHADALCPIEEDVELSIALQPVHVTEPPPASSLKDLSRCYRELWKARLSGLLVFTAGGAYYACGGNSWQEVSSLCAGTFLQAACANSLNEIIEIDRDKIMARTKGRPLPTGRISKKHAIIQAIVVGVGGTYILYKFNNPLTSVIGAANIFLYAGVYTPLKVRSVLNTWVGTVNGSLPPLMGASAATGNITDPMGLFLFGIMYLWQITHFMAINYKCKSDYGRAGYRMLANENPSLAATHALVHSALLFPICWTLPLVNVAPWWFAALSTPINYHFLFKPSIEFKKDINYDKATRLFFKSLAHLSLLFGATVAAVWWKRSIRTLIVESNFWKKVTSVVSKMLF